MSIKLIVIRLHCMSNYNKQVYVAYYTKIMHMVIWTIIKLIYYGHFSMQTLQILLYELLSDAQSS